MPSLAATARPPHPRGRPPTPGLRDAILRAGEEIFARRPYHAVQMDDVARACGAGKGTLYRYFRSKRDLYVAVVFHGVQRLRGELEAVARTGEPPARKIEMIVRHTLGHFWDHREFFVLLQENGDAREWARQRGRLTRLVQDVIAQAIAAGHMRPMDARIATEMLFGMMRGVNRYHARGETLNALATSVVDLFMRGAATPEGSGA
jgi:AcrR family transcriptional regulator